MLDYKGNKYALLICDDYTSERHVTRFKEKNQAGVELRSYDQAMYNATGRHVCTIRADNDMAYGDDFMDK